MGWSISGEVSGMLGNIHPHGLLFYHIITFLNRFKCVVHLVKCLRKGGNPGK
jgi:hypothetical protein